MENDTNFSKQFLEQLSGDLDTVADYLDDSGKSAKAEILWRAMRVIRSITPIIESGT